MTDAQYIAIHHTAGPRSQTVDEIRQFHVQTRRYSDIGYNLVIPADGSLVEGRGIYTKGAHAGPKWNARAIGIAVVGYNGHAEHPEWAWNDLQKAMLRSVVACLCTVLPRAVVVPHSHLRLTVCPGLTWQELRSILGEWMLPEEPPRP